MEFKYIISYSYCDGEISNTVGCHTLNQVREVSEAILQWLMDNFNVRAIDFVEIYGADGELVERIF